APADSASGLARAVNDSVIQEISRVELIASGDSVISEVSRVEFVDDIEEIEELDELEELEEIEELEEFDAAETNTSGAIVEVARELSNFDGTSDKTGSKRKQHLDFPTERFGRKTIPLPKPIALDDLDGAPHSDFDLARGLPAVPKVAGPILTPRPAVGNAWEELANAYADLPTANKDQKVEVQL